MSGQTPSEGRRAEGGLRHVQPTLPASHSPSPPFLRHNGCLGVVTAYAIGSNFKQVGKKKSAQWGGRGNKVMEVPPLLCAHTGLGLMPHSPSSPAPTNVSV